MNSSSILPSLLAFAFVVALIPVSLALLKRSQHLRGGHPGLLSMLGALAVGPRERVAIVEAGGRYLVIGVTAQSISLLATLDERPAGLDAAVANPTAFSQLLSRLKQDGSKSA